MKWLLIAMLLMAQPTNAECVKTSVVAHVMACLADEWVQGSVLDNLAIIEYFNGVRAEASNWQEKQVSVSPWIREYTEEFEHYSCFRQWIYNTPMVRWDTSWQFAGGTLYFIIENNTNQPIQIATAIIASYDGTICIGTPGVGGASAVVNIATGGAAWVEAIGYPSNPDRVEFFAVSTTEPELGFAHHTWLPPSTVEESTWGRIKVLQEAR